VGRTGKACVSKEAYKPDSVTPGLSAGMGQNSPNLLWEASGRLPKTYDPRVNNLKAMLPNTNVSVCKLLPHWECDEINKS
jgi:hypothetical protein